MKTRISKISLLFFLMTMAAAALHAASPADALRISIDTGKAGGGISMPIQILFLLTILGLAPSILVMATSFVRIVTVLSFLRTGLSVQQPSNQVLLSIALFLTAYIMAPVWQAIHRDAIQPWSEKRMTGEQALERGSGHLKAFMLRHTRERDLRLFMQMSPQPTKAAQPRDLPLQTVLSAFMLSELRTAFQMGLMVLLPFLVIDLVVSSVLMTLGMMMLPPTVVALPLKIMVFVLVDGWSLIIRSLVTSFD